MRDNRPPQQHRCYSSFSRPSRTGFPGVRPSRKGSPVQRHHTEYSLEGMHPQEPQVFLELTCCGKRVLDTEVQSQDAEEQAWNGGGMTETITSAVHFTHSPKNLHSSMGSLTSKHQIQLPPTSLEPGYGQFPSGRLWEYMPEIRGSGWTQGTGPVAERPILARAQGPPGTAGTRIDILACRDRCCSLCCSRALVTLNAGDEPPATCHLHPPAASPGTWQEGPWSELAAGGDNSAVAAPASAWHAAWGEGAEAASGQVT